VKPVRTLPELTINHSIYLRCAFIYRPTMSMFGTNNGCKKCKGTIHGAPVKVGKDNYHMKW